MKRKEYPGGNGIRFAPILTATKVEGRAEDGDAKRFEVAFSSENPVDRMGFFGNWREVLGHGPGEVQMGRFLSGRANMLEEHRGAPIGVIESASIDEDRMGRAVVRTSRTQRGRDAALDMEDSTRSNISVGYIPKRAKLIEENEELGDLWRVTLWEPVELSLVGVPADDAVGVGRNLRDGYPPVETEGPEDGPDEEEPEMRKKKVRDEKGAVIEVPEDDPRAEYVEQRSLGVEVLDHEQERQSIRAAEVERSETIRALCQMNELPSERGDEAIRKGVSVAEFTREVLKARETKAGSTPSAEALDGLSDKDRRNWSFVRAIRLGAGIAAREKGGDDGDELGRIKFDGLEAEVHRELAKKMPENAERRGGILIPMDLRTREERLQAEFQKRTLAGQTATKGAETIFDSPGEFIELLRSAAVVAQMGARFLTGLSGPIGFVKQTGGVTVYWVGEAPGADTPDSDLTLALVTMAPKTLQATSGYTRQLLMQSSVGIEAMTRTEFAEAHSRAIDKAALHGKGAAGEPMGVYLAPGVGAQAFGGPPSWDLAVDTITKVAVANAARGTLGWITTPGLAGKMKKTPEHATMFGASWLWRGRLDSGEVADYPAVSTTQMSTTMNGSEETGGTSHGIVFGNWAEVIFGLYNTTEIVVDPYRLKKRGIIEVTSFQMADLILRHGESFTKGTGATV